MIVPGAATVTEGDTGTRTLNVPVSLSASSPLPVTAHWTTANYTAAAPSDYAASSGTVTFAPGETTKTVPITVKGDTAIEPNEALLVAFSAADERHDRRLLRPRRRDDHRRRRRRGHHAGPTQS